MRDRSELHGRSKVELRAELAVAQRDLDQAAQEWAQVFRSPQEDDWSDVFAARDARRFAQRWVWEVEWALEKVS